MALFQTVPLGMGGLRRSVQTFPFSRRSIDHFKRTLHDNNFYCRDRLGKLSISAYIFFFEVLSHSFFYVAGPGQASSSSTWPSFS